MKGKGILEDWGKKEAEGKRAEQRKIAISGRHRKRRRAGELIEGKRVLELELELRRMEKVK